MNGYEFFTTYLKEKITPRNPLGIIALFVSFIEAVATVSLKIVADAGAGILWAIVLFIILYPTIIAIFFFVILWKKSEILFGPMDFPDPKSFENILLQGFQRIEAKQEAAIIDVNTARSILLDLAPASLGVCILSERREDSIPEISQ